MRIHLQAGQSVVVHGAAGIVGSMTAKLAREAGAYVIGTGRAGSRQTALEAFAIDAIASARDELRT